MNRITHVREFRGEQISIVPLTRELAVAHADRLVTVHNQIPHQHWSVADVLADADGSRKFLGKWDISRVAFSEQGELVAFCIGFEREPDGREYQEPCIYLHRLGVAREFKGRLIGALVQADTIQRAFQRGLRLLPGPHPTEGLRVFGQTNLEDSNRSVIAFHRASGYVQIGRKEYSDRTDAVMAITLASFQDSRHKRLLLARLVNGF